MKQHFINFVTITAEINCRFCSYCNKPFIPNTAWQINCNKKCTALKYANTERGIRKQKENHKRYQAEGRAYYQTENGKKTNKLRSKKYRLLNNEKVTKYKKIKAREYAEKIKQKHGVTKTPEQMKKVVYYHRLNQRLARQSIKGTLAATTSLNNNDIIGIQQDIEQLKLLIKNTKIQLES